ncbi:MAG: HNH endonuclease [Desulfuromonadales bacterium]|nr:HNH endonuclease [Desulfuromonadales bacterium]
MPITLWLDRLCQLNVSRSAGRGSAPHKPLLLLCLIDMVEDGSLTTPSVDYTPELFFRFQSYWPLVYARQQNQPDMRLPFHALGSDRDQIWTRLTASGEPSPSKETTRRCLIDPSLWAALQSPAFRRAARLRLITTYFLPVEQIALCARLNLPAPTGAEVDAIKASTDAYRQSQKKGRDARFRSSILLGYRFTCALTGTCLSTERENLVEAAHIHQHAQSGNDDPGNGLALTPDAHWMFDRGLWTVEVRGDDFIIRVAKGKFRESYLSGFRLAERDAQPLIFVADTDLRPEGRHFLWHRERRFVGAMS